MLRDILERAIQKATGDDLVLTKHALQRAQERCDIPTEVSPDSFIRQQFNQRTYLHIRRQQGGYIFTAQCPKCRIVLQARDDAGRHWLALTIKPRDRQPWDNGKSYTTSRQYKKRKEREQGVSDPQKVPDTKAWRTWHRIHGEF